MRFARTITRGMRTERATARPAPLRRGFSLLEALIASVILAIAVLAVGAAVSAGRAQAQESEKVILATIAADDFLSELTTESYAGLDAYDGMVQPIGAMMTVDGASYPDTFWLVGRSVTVAEQDIATGEAGVTVRGKRVVVSAFDDMRTLAQLETFIPEPAAESVDPPAPPLPPLGGLGGLLGGLGGL